MPLQAIGTEFGGRDHSHHCLLPSATLKQAMKRDDQSEAAGRGHHQKHQNQDPLKANGLPFFLPHFSILCKQISDFRF